MQHLAWCTACTARVGYPQGFNREAGAFPARSRHRIGERICRKARCFRRKVKMCVFR